jgi:hypothetical protein
MGGTGIELLNVLLVLSWYYKEIDENNNLIY